MLIKHCKHGTGSGQDASDYLTRDTDHKGREREDVKVLRGDPQEVANVIDSLEFKHKYSSAVVAWSPDDQPTEKEINKVLEDYERLAFAGIEPQNYSSCSVLHRDEKGGCHVHILSARVDLDTGKSINPCAPGQMYQFANLAEAHNYQNGWVRPDDLSRTRLCSKGHLHFKDAEAVRAGLEVEPGSKQLLTDFIAQRVMQGLIENRSGVVAALSEFGEITRQGKDYISLKLEGEKKAMRFKGGLFNEEFSRENTVEATRRFEADRGVDQGQSRTAFRKFEKDCQSRTEYNFKRYRERKQTSEKRNQKPRSMLHKTVDNDNAISRIDLSCHLSRSLGDDAILYESTSGHKNRGRGNGATSKEARGSKGNRSEQIQGWEGTNYSEPEVLDDFQDRKSEYSFRLKKIIEGLKDDRTRKLIARQIERSDQAKRRLSGACREASGACQRFGESVQNGVPRFIGSYQAIRAKMVNEHSKKQQDLHQKKEAKRGREYSMDMGR